MNSPCAAPAWAVGDRAMWLSEMYHGDRPCEIEVEVLAVGHGLLAVKVVDAPEGRPFCAKPATLRRPAPKRRKVVVAEWCAEGGVVRWDQFKPEGFWAPTGRTHEFEVSDE